MFVFICAFSVLQINLFDVKSIYCLQVKSANVVFILNRIRLSMYVRDFIN